MSEQESPKQLSQTSLTAGITGLLIGIASLFIANSSPEVKTIIPIVAGIISPFIAALISKWQRKIEQPAELTDYITAYENDLNYQKKALKNKSLTKAARTQLEKKQAETILKMATAHQDFRSGILNISTTIGDDA